MHKFFAAIHIYLIRIAVIRLLPLFFMAALLASCATTKNYSPNKKYGKAELQEDYTLLKNILQSKHPSLYWYTSKDSMDMYFNRYYQAIGDSMTEQQFGWKVLAPLTDKIHCGHTSFGMSKAYNRWSANKRFPSFPLFIRIWNDSMVVTGNLNRKDSLIKRGMVLTAINGMRTSEMVQTLFGFMTEDGNANNVNYQRLGNNFPYYHRNVFGLYKNYDISYLDSTGKELQAKLPLYDPAADTLDKRKIKPLVKLTKKQKKAIKNQGLQLRHQLIIDTANNTAVMVLNTFSGGRLRRFFRRSFKKIRQQNISNLVIDLRSNGGGKIGNSTLLTRYVTRQSFKIADSATVMAASLRPYTKYIKGRMLNNIGLSLFSKRRADGRRHFGYWERKTYYPKNNNHFGGPLYVLINGSTFSASTLFCNDIRGQRDITLVGEAAGGGWHGNSGVMIPDITLPNTRMRVRLPLVRLVQYKHVPQNGLGVMPDLYVPPNYAAFMKGVDKKLQVVMEMIKAKQK
jgi:Peptidase family S41